MQVIIRQSEIGSTSVHAVATYEDNVSIDLSAYSPGMVVIKDVPPSKLAAKMNPGSPPTVSLDAQWLAANAPQGFKG